MCCSSSELELEVQLPVHTDLFPKAPASIVMPQVQEFEGELKERRALLSVFRDHGLVCL